MRTTLSLLAALAALVVALPAAAAAPSYVFKPIGTGFVKPVYVTAAPGDSSLYVVEQRGTVRVFRNGRIAGTFLDLRAKVLEQGERGLLSIAFHPRYTANHLLYVSYSDLAGDTHVSELRAENGVAQPGSERELLLLQQPFENHKGGQLQFDRQGRLYVGLGDGGTDPNATHGDEAGRAQDVNAMYGKLARIDPLDSAAKWQLVGLGLRNPWRFSFDRKTGDLWLADLGTHLYEEVDFRKAPLVGSLANYGWGRWEARAVYNPDIHPSAGATVFPLYAYRWKEATACGVIGGYVYRGARFPALRGRYFFGDLCSGAVTSLVRTAQGRVHDVKRAYGRVDALTSFGEGPGGELYAVGIVGDLYALAKR